MGAMRQAGWLAVLAAVVAVPALVRGKAEEAPAQKVQLPCKVYTDCEDPGEAPFVASGWMGKVDSIEYNDCCRERPRSGRSCIQVAFTDTKGWGGIVWQNPANNWGDSEGGVDLTGARQLSFWARGEKGGEIVDFKMGIINRGKPYWDTAKGALEKVRLSREWKQYTIPLASKDLSRIVTGFVFSTAGRKDPVVFYLDDIIYE